MNERKAYVMVGAPGAGKSTYSTAIAVSQPCVIVGGDSVREELYGDANIQGNWFEIQDRIEEYVQEAAGNNKVVILDGTHYSSRYRKEAIAMLQSYGYSDIEAIVVNPPLEVCLKQNASRDRKVPDHVIEKMHSKLQASLPHIEKDGFSRVTYF